LSSGEVGGSSGCSERQEGCLRRFPVEVGGDAGCGEGRREGLRRLSVHELEHQRTAGEGEARPRQERGSARFCQEDQRREDGEEPVSIVCTGGFTDTADTGASELAPVCSLRACTSQRNRSLRLAVGGWGLLRRFAPRNDTSQFFPMFRVAGTVHTHLRNSLMYSFHQRRSICHPSGLH